MFVGGLVIGRFVCWWVDYKKVCLLVGWLYEGVFVGGLVIRRCVCWWVGFTKVCLLVGWL